MFYQWKRVKDTGGIKVISFSKIARCQNQVWCIYVYIYCDGIGLVVWLCLWLDHRDKGKITLSYSLVPLCLNLLTRPCLTYNMLFSQITFLLSRAKVAISATYRGPFNSLCLWIFVKLILDLLSESNKEHYHPLNTH